MRYKEDLPPLGLDFIKLGLNDVLYDPKTKQIYTPNTNQTAQMSGNMLTDSSGGGIIEDRRKHKKKKVNYIQNPKTGLLEGSTSDGGDDLDSDKIEETEKSSIKAIEQQKDEIRSALKGTKTVTGIIISHVSEHAADRMIERRNTVDRVKNALTNSKISYPGNTQGTHCVQSGNIRVVYSDDGNIISVINL